jgi:Lar family restriction alleviation protein
MQLNCSPDVGTDRVLEMTDQQIAKTEQGDITAASKSIVIQVECQQQRRNGIQAEKTIEAIRKNNMREVKPCPFKKCGGEAEFIVGDIHTIVRCKKCGIRTPSFFSKVSAADWWNTRADSSKPSWDDAPKWAE